MRSIRLHLPSSLLLTILVGCGATPPPDFAAGTEGLPSLAVDDVDELRLDPGFGGVAPDTLWIPRPGYDEARTRLEQSETPLPEERDLALGREAERLRAALQRAAYDAGALLSQEAGARSWTLRAELLELTPTSRWLNEQGAESHTVEGGTIEIQLRLDDPEGRAWMYLRDRQIGNAPRRGEGFGTWYGHDIASFQRWAARVAQLVSNKKVPTSP